MNVFMFTLDSSRAKKEEVSNSPVIAQNWKLAASREASERFITLRRTLPQGTESLTMIVDLNGACLLPDDASAVVFDQPAGNWRFVSLINYVENCYSGTQRVSIPIADFGLDIHSPVDNFHMRMWLDNPYQIMVHEVSVGGHKSAVEPAPSLKPDMPASTTIQPQTPIIPTPNQPTLPASRIMGSEFIRSVDAMKETKDRVCGPRDATFVNSWVKKAKELGANYVAISTPYEDPSCASSMKVTTLWVETIRAHGLNVWHRHMPLAFEGIYDVPKKKVDYLPSITRYIQQNPGLFQEGDIFTPIPEPQNGGIEGITYCPEGVCQFKNTAEFNRWLRDAMTLSRREFEKIGIGDIGIGYYGLDGFIVWGANNPDWSGFLEDETVEMMGNITLDHYPQLINTSFRQDLAEFRQKYPTIPLIIGEWGAVGPSSKSQQITDAITWIQQDPYLTGFNYWHMGMGGNEAIINESFQALEGFSEIKAFFQNYL